MKKEGLKDAKAPIHVQYIAPAHKIVLTITCVVFREGHEESDEIMGREFSNI